LKILHITQYYFPLRIAASLRQKRIDDTLISAGCDVRVLCGIGLKGAKSNDIITRVPFSGPSNNLLLTILGQVFFGLAVFLLGILSDTDVIIATTPPPFGALASVLVAKIRRKKIILDVRDLWPGELVATGALSIKPVIKFMCFIEKKIYRSSSMILTVSPRLASHIKKITNSPVRILMNAVDDTIFLPSKNRRATGRLKIIYSGSINKEQSLSTAIDAFKVLQERNITGVELLIVGSGSEYEEVYRYSQINKCIKVKPYVQEGELVKLIQESDIGLVTLAKHRIFYGAIPSKTFEYMACQKPVIVSAKGDIESVVVHGVNGFVVPPEKPLELARLIMSIIKKRKILLKLGINAKKDVENKYNQTHFMKILNSYLRELLETK